MSRCGVGRRRGFSRIVRGDAAATANRRIQPVALISSGAECLAPPIASDVVGQVLQLRVLVVEPLELRLEVAQRRLRRGRRRRRRRAGSPSSTVDRE